MSLVVTYRRYAADCLAVAQRAPDEARRRILIETAARWHRMAATVERYMEQHEGLEPPLFAPVKESRTATP